MVEALVIGDGVIVEAGVSVSFRREVVDTVLSVFIKELIQGCIEGTDGVFGARANVFDSSGVICTGVKVVVMD